MEFELLNEYIAPWVLTKEPIPFHCVWKPNEKLDKIEFKLPENYELMETLNFTNYNQKDNVASVFTKSLKSNNYFGAVICYPYIIDKIEKKDDVIINFRDKKGAVIKNIVLKTRIIRPKLKISNYKDIIIIKDDVSLKDLINLEILHQGHGSANLSINVEHGGKIISYIDSLYYDALEKISDEVVNLSEVDINDMYDLDYEKYQELVGDIVNAIFKESERRRILSELDDETFLKITKILKNESKKQLIYRIILKNLRSLLLSAILYIREKNPEEGIKLIYGNTSVDLTEKIEELMIEIKYSDSMNNYYPPLTANIMVVDLRRKLKDNKEKFEAPVNIIWKRELMYTEDF